MANAYSSQDLLGFLEHAGARGLMPVATAQALAVATRNVLSVLNDEERRDLSGIEVSAIIRRFNNKRAKDFTPSSLKEYGRRVHRATDLFLAWREDPANFSAPTRSTSAARRSDKERWGSVPSDAEGVEARPDHSSAPGTYKSSIPVRPGIVLTVSNIPYDLSRAEAERLAAFIRMLAVEG